MRHTIGWLNKPTRDGRVLTEITFRESPMYCVTVAAHTTYEALGNAWDFQIAEDGEITCVTDVPMILANEALSLNLDSNILDSFTENGVAYLSGRLTMLTLIPRETWAWK